MNLKHLLPLILLITLTTATAQDQDSIPKYELELKGLISNSNTVPFWLTYGRYGIYDGFENEALAIADVDVPLYFGKNWKIETGLKAVGKNQFSESFLQEAYLNINYGSFKLRMGKEEFTLTQYSEDLSAGSFYLSNNARPIPRVGAGFYEYTDVPFTKGYVQFKGFLNQGVLNDDRGPKGTDKPLFHEKSAYLRLNNLIINPYAGINHSAFFGGTRPDGKEIPVDYWAVFFGKSSDKVGAAFPGEGTNVAGAHLGLADFGLTFDIDNIHVTTYYQKIFSDRSGFWQFFEKNHDRVFGIAAKVDGGKWVKEFVFENSFTLWQSGPGSVDPYVNGKSFISGSIDDYNQFIFDNYGITVDFETDDEFMDFLKKMENHGFEYGGRDNYYNNGLYYQGWSYYGKSLGTPLFLTEDRINSFTNEFDGTWDKFFVNNRIKSNHIGIKGEISERLNYLLKYTYTRNYGTYFGLNKGPHRWESAEPFSEYDYYFEEKLSQSYFLLEGNYDIKSMEGLKVNFSMGLDYGDMYNSFGVILGATYSGNFKLKERRH